MEVCWCGCGAEWSSDTEWEWAATDEWTDYAEPVYAEPTYYEPIVYTDPFVTESIVYTEPVYAEPVYTEPVYTEPAYSEPVYTEPYVEAAPVADPGIAIVGGPTAGFEPVVFDPAPVADPGIAIVGGPTAGFEPVAFDPAPVADPGIAIVGGPTAGFEPDVMVTETPSVVLTNSNVTLIGGTPLEEYDVTATEWDSSWDIFLNNRATTSGDPIADQVIANGIATTAMREIDINLSNAGTWQTNWSTPSSEFSYNSSGRLVNSPYYNEFKP